MKIFKSIIFIGALHFLCTSTAFAQEDWIVPKAEKENVSIHTFDEAFAREGETIYKHSCISCHGDPGQANYTPMVPPPGDITSEIIQDQLDGELHYKIVKGRGAMPSFENALSSKDIWSLIAYFRSFNENYTQATPDLEGIEVPVFVMKLTHDENVDKLVVKIFNEDQTPVIGADVTAFVKGLFGNMLLGKTQTNKLGISYFDVDAKLPGNIDGEIEVFVTASKGYGSVKETQKLSMVQPVLPLNITEGRHLWSVAKKAPIWLITVFYVALISIWGAIMYVVIGLRKIKKL